MNDAEKQLKLSKVLLQKYAYLINEKEQRTIGEIKTLVDGTDLSIQTIIEEFKNTTYSFKEDYEKILRKIYVFIINDIDFIDTNFGINYWLTPREIIDLKLADDEDLAVFTCNFMKALGDDNAEVIVAELENLKTHAFVTTEINKKFLILDPAQKKDFDTFFGNKTEILKKYSFKENKIRKFLYRFNSEKYEQFLEE